MRIPIYKTELEAMAALANKKDQTLWTIKRNDNGWYYLGRKENNLKKYTVDCDEELWVLLKMKAARLRITIKAALNAAIERWVQENGRDEE